MGFKVPFWDLDSSKILQDELFIMLLTTLILAAPRPCEHREYTVHVPRAGIKTFLTHNGSSMQTSEVL